MRRQTETIDMMRILSLLHHKKIHVDDYILQEFSSSDQEKISGNQEIILSLIRLLASHF